MFGAKIGGVAAYSKIGLETGVDAASPHKLIVMLFDGALEALRMGRVQMKAGDITGKGQSISKAATIVSSGLRASLDLQKGGEIAGSLDALYDYMARRLMMSHLHNSVDGLDEVEKLLVDLREAWNAIGEPVPAAAPVAAAPVAAPVAPVMADPLAPRRTAFVSA
jgi:flagellar secretion chaperone FliS